MQLCTSMKTLKMLCIDNTQIMMKLFLDPKGDYATSVSTFMAACVLDPLHAQDMDPDQMINAIKSFHHFGFDEFRQGRGIVEDVITELPKYRAAVASTTATFCSGVEGAFKYDAKLSTQAKENPEKYGDRTWRDDRVEKARMVYGNGGGPKLHFSTSSGQLPVLLLLFQFQAPWLSASSVR